ncbi:MAG: transcriptional repressor [Clostridiales bacterium]|jgi:Fur family ferric uptake transcriptional regulator|nr:transcriptional repressor [Clostridiales bacterium]
MKDMNFGRDLARKGLRNTKHRAAILSILEQSEQPLTAEQVFLELKERGEPANLSTVYRVLDVFTDKRMVKKLNITGGGRSLYEYDRMVHNHHLLCLGCKKILAIGSCPLGDYEKILAEKTDFAIEGHRLDIYGYCPECRREN